MLFNKTLIVEHNITQLKKKEHIDLVNRAFQQRCMAGKGIWLMNGYLRHKTLIRY